MKNLFTKKNTKPLFSQKRSAGFTLLETLVAISILSLSIVGAFGVAQSGLSSAIVARDQIIAFQLAQEAIEHVKNVRDTNTYNGATNGSAGGWLTGLSQCMGVDCELNILTRSLTQCTGTTLCKVVKNTNGFYIQATGGTPTVFTRRIRLENVASNSTNREVKISVTMLWQKGSVPRQFTVEEHMFNWQQGL